MDSKTGLIIQFTGIILVTALSLFLRRSMKTPASTLWLVAWSSLSAGLFSLSLAFANPAVVLFTGYFFFEYVFGLMLFLGCRSLAEPPEPRQRTVLKLVPFMILAIALSIGIIDFNYVFNVHALVMGFFFLASFVVLGRSSIKSFGWRVMRIALALLALDFAHYAIMFTLLMVFPNLLPENNYLAFEPIIDLVLEIMLGFGMVIVLLEQILEEVKSVNLRLKEAHEKLKEIAHIDPLTAALNRHAFYGFLGREDREEISGCVGFFDIDDLKPINDQLGHAVGDSVIRKVASSIRQLIRAEDLIFRWGGDEFFVVMAGLTEEMATKRMETLERKLTDVEVEGTQRALTIRVSYGFKYFADSSGLESAVSAADELMYARKQARKTRRRRHENGSVFISNENIVLQLQR